ncbi:MAG: hypothetical protein SRB2_00138 [Desulfobacteraceae bacterium Eth-SRB2]|nr:MAG: hypothetical protein SRB2_00138 [Desulfobacteraceae bacterium Eth-SRB2]
MQHIKSSKIGPLVPYVYMKSMGARVFTEKTVWGITLSTEHIGQHFKDWIWTTGAVHYEFTYDNNKLVGITDRLAIGPALKGCGRRTIAIVSEGTPPPRLP